jgi:hypothetical protein
MNALQSGQPLSLQQALLGGRTGLSAFELQQGQLEAQRKRAGAERLQRAVPFAVAAQRAVNTPVESLEESDALLSGARHELASLGISSPEIDGKFASLKLLGTPEARREGLMTLVSSIPGLEEMLTTQSQKRAAVAKTEAEVRKLNLEAGQVGEDKPTADMLNYRQAQQQGFKGSFLDYKTQLAQARRSQVTVPVTVGGEAKPTPLQVKSDEAFAKDYIAWKQGGGVNTVKNTAQIGSVLQQLEEGKPLTGPLIGIQPDIVLAVTNPNAVDARQRVEQVAQESLRAILGAQFTQKEGEAFIARVYNPSLKPEKNASRLRALFKQLETAAAQKQAMVDYADEKGTVAGFKGKVPTIQDFYDAIDEKPSRSETTPPTVVRMPNGASYSFPDAEAAANFRKAAGLKE